MPAAAHFLIVATDSNPKSMLVAEPTANDLEFADEGLFEIIRLADLHRYQAGAWHPIPAGQITRVDDPDYADRRPFHHLPEQPETRALPRRAGC